MNKKVLSFLFVSFVVPVGQAFAELDPGREAVIKTAQEVFADMLEGSVNHEVYSKYAEMIRSCVATGGQAACNQLYKDTDIENDKNYSLGARKAQEAMSSDVVNFILYKSQMPNIGEGEASSIMSSVVSHFNDFSAHNALAIECLKNCVASGNKSCVGLVNHIFADGAGRDPADVEGVSSRAFIRTVAMRFIKTQEQVQSPMPSFSSRFYAFLRKYSFDQSNYLSFRKNPKNFIEMTKKEFEESKIE